MMRETGFYFYVQRYHAVPLRATGVDAVYCISGKTGAALGTTLAWREDPCLNRTALSFAISISHEIILGNKKP